MVKAQLPTTKNSVHHYNMEMVSISPISGEPVLNVVMHSGHLWIISGTKVNGIITTKQHTFREFRIVRIGPKNFIEIATGTPIE